MKTSIFTCSFTILCASSSDFLSVKLSGKEGRYKNDANISSFEGSILVFPDIPVGKEIRIPNMELPKERSLLYVLSCAIEYLHQNEFPLGKNVVFATTYVCVSLAAYIKD